MTRPGVDVALLDTVGASIAVPVDTSTWFITGLTEKGAIGPQLVVSLDDYVATYGQRVAYGVLYDCLETFFREGGYRAYVSRVVGPSATSGTKNLLDSGAAISLVATALGPGAWSANYKIAVVAGSVGGTFVIQVTDTSNNVLEDSGNLATQNDAILWAMGSSYIRLALGASANNPAVAAAAALSAGTDDRNNITDTEWLNAANLFGIDIGPGQVSHPGRTTTTAHTQLITHAETRNRVALLDLPDSASEATLAAAIGRSRFAAAFAPWVLIPGLTAGTTRIVPPSALIAGLIGRNDPGLGANHPSAGRFGLSSFAVDLSQPAWTDSVRQTLNLDSVNVIRWLYGVIAVYGWRSTANPNSDSNWIDFGNARLFMKLGAELNQVGQNYMFEEIDGQHGRTIGGFHDALSGVLMSHFNIGELFGDTADQAFYVDTGVTVNTLERIQNMELHAVCYVKMSPYAEYIQIQIVKRRLTEALV